LAFFFSFYFSVSTFPLREDTHFFDFGKIRFLAIWVNELFYSSSLGLEWVFIIPSQTLGVLDLETYVDDFGISKVYSCGFKTNLEEKAFTYYIDKNTLDSDELILKLIDELLKDKYSGIKFFVHNLGNFDSIFILKCLCDFNDKEVESPYVIDIIYRDNTILKMTIRRKISKRIYSLVICDSLPLLNSNLRDLGKKFEVETQKGDFPHKFATKDTLFYTGDIPEFKFYENVDLNTYNTMITDK